MPAVLAGTAKRYQRSKEMGKPNRFEKKDFGAEVASVQVFRQRRPYLKLFPVTW